MFTGSRTQTDKHPVREGLTGDGMYGMFASKFPQQPCNRIIELKLILREYICMRTVMRSSSDYGECEEDERTRGWGS